MWVSNANVSPFRVWISQNYAPFLPPALPCSPLSLASDRSTRSFSFITKSIFQPVVSQHFYRSFYHSTLRNSLIPPNLCQLSHHFTFSSVLIHNSSPSEQSTAFCLKVQNSSFLQLFAFNTRSLDWYLRYWRSFVCSSHTHFVIILFHSCQFVFNLFCKFLIISFH